MDIIGDFIGQYRKQYDFYDQAARLVAGMLETGLQEAGIRAIVTSRAKSISRIEPKVRGRNFRRKIEKQSPYTSTREIFEDIVDLAGVRVALYFPGQAEQVAKVINDLFAISKQKHFPDGSSPKYNKRFTGYCADHYHVSLKEEGLPETSQRYAEARIEIQVASVLMHAWSEVEHDLVYKPLQGGLSDEEYRHLDTLNGMVQTGEQLLQSLQEAGERRVASSGRDFQNHFELATYILGQIKVVPEAIGRVDALYELLVELKQTTPSQVDVILHSLNMDGEGQPVSEQIIEYLIRQNKENFELYQKLLASRIRNNPSSVDAVEAKFAFLNAWNTFEQVMESQAEADRGGEKPRGPLNIPALLHRFDITQDNAKLIVELRDIRNRLVHGRLTNEVYSVLPSATTLLDNLRHYLETNAKKSGDKSDDDNQP